MNIFEQVKGYVTAGQAAEQYGIKINRNKMACCPFHNDRHPSMKRIIVLPAMQAVMLSISQRECLVCHSLRRQRN